MERDVDETLIYRGRTYKCVSSKGTGGTCKRCAFKFIGTDRNTQGCECNRDVFGECEGEKRSDGITVHFIKRGM